MSKKTMWVRAAVATPFTFALGLYLVIVPGWPQWVAVAIATAPVVFAATMPGRDDGSV